MNMPDTNKGTRGEFKRVNAIDQVSNEGKPTQAHEYKKLKVLNGRKVFLFRMYDAW